MNHPIFHYNPNISVDKSKKSFLTFGNFDGVHVGHQTLLKNLDIQSTLTHSLSTVLTFYPHPSRLFNPLDPSHLLLTLEDRIDLIFSFGIKCVAVQKFDKSFAALNADDFCNDYLLNNFNIKGLYVGYDLKYGSMRSGNSNHMNLFCKKNNFFLQTEKSQSLDNQIVSSSIIRNCLRSGNIKEVNKLLGRFFQLSGVIFKGDQRGRKMGFPTANIRYTQEALPAAGVYFVLVSIDGDSHQYPAVMNCGYRPTISSDLVFQIEAHILNFNKDIYDTEVTFYVLDFLRNEMKFLNIQDLILQIKKDVESSYNYFAKKGLICPKQ